jgi:hypothetical protein
MYSLGCCRLLRRFWQIRICARARGQRGALRGRGRGGGRAGGADRAGSTPEGQGCTHHLWEQFSRRVRLLDCLLRGAGSGTGGPGVGEGRSWPVAEITAAGVTSKKTRPPDPQPAAHQVQQQELLDRVVLRRQHVAHDRDEQLGQALPVQQHGHRLLHGHHLGHRVVALQRLLNLIGRGRLVAVNQHGAAALDGIRHGELSSAQTRGSSSAPLYWGGFCPTAALELSCASALAPGWHRRGAIYRRS